MRIAICARSTTVQIAIVLFVAFLHAGCSSSPPTTTQPAKSAAPALASAPSNPATVPSTAPTAFDEIIRSNDGAYTIHFRTTPHPIPSNEPFDVEALVVLANGPAPDDLSLTIDAAMPHHQHGMNRLPRTERLGPGRFVARGLLFHMTGYWELYFDVTRNGVTERAQAEVNLE